MKKILRTVLYTRVSTTAKIRHGETLAFDQDPAIQERPLRELAAQRGWTIHRLYSDRASGAKERRPGLDALMRDARRGEFDAVAVWRFDRFARSVKQLILALEEFRSLGIDFVSHQEALDTSTPMGKAMFTIIGAMAELERSIIRERVIAGLDYARENGTKSGKSLGRPRLVFDRDEIHRLRQSGASIAAIVRETGLSNGTVCRVLKSATNRALQKPPGRARTRATQVRRLA